MSIELKAVSRMAKGQSHIQPTNLVPENGTMNVLAGATLAGKRRLTVP